MRVLHSGFLAVEADAGARVTAAGPDLIRRLWSAQSLALAPGPVEETGTALAGREHVAGIGDAPFAVSALFPEVIQWIQSLRATGVRLDHCNQAAPFGLSGRSNVALKRMVAGVDVSGVVRHIVRCVAG